MLKKSLPYAFGHFFLIAYQWMAIIFLPVFYKEAGLGEAAAGSTVSLFSLSTLLLIFPMGVLSDRLPPRPMLVAGAVLAGVGAGGLSFSSGRAALMAFTLVSGSGFTLSSISLFSLFFKQVDASRRGFEVSIFYVGGIMGAGTGVVVFGFLAEISRLSLALLCVGSALPVMWACAALFLPAQAGIAFPILDYGKDLKLGRTWALIAIMFVAASHTGFEQASYGLIQTEVLGLGPLAIGGIFFALSVWMALVAAEVGKLHDIDPANPVLWIGFALMLSGVFMAASGSALGPADFTGIRALHTAGDSVFNLLAMVVASTIFPRKRAGGAFAFALTINTASYFAFANIGGLVGEAYGLSRSFHMAGSVEIAGGIALVVFRRKLRALFLIG